MATAYRVGRDHPIVLQLDWPGFDPDRHRLTLRAGDRAYRIDVDGVSPQGWLRLVNLSFSLDRVIVDHAADPLAVVVSDLGRREHFATLPLVFHHSFFAPLVDFTAVPLPGFSVAAYPKPALLAAFTHVYNDRTMLGVWERHYAAFGPEVDLFVLDHGSDVPARDGLLPRTQCVRLPRGAADQANIASFCSHYQRFLLTQYRWVIHVDVDELLVPEDGPAGLLARLRADEGPPRIVEPGRAVDLVMHPDQETPVDLSRDITRQRRHMVPNAEYRKPALVSRPTTWGPGFHYAVEAFDVVEDPRLWMVHLAKADLALCLERNRKWRATARSATDEVRVDHTHRRQDEGQMRETFRSLVTSAHAHPVPEWMVGAF